MLTYNHAAFIEQAIESVLTQQTDFAYELIIGEDCSTDQTRRIIESYARKYPDRILPLYHAHNQGMGLNLKACLAVAKGRFVAPLEGDDYWLDPRKLQKQVDYLLAHPEVALCFHEVQIVEGAHAHILRVTSNRENYTMQELVTYGRTIPMTCSMLLRREQLQLPEWLFTVALLDYPIVIMQAAHGVISRLPEVMAAYRRHAGGVWSGASPTTNQRRFIHMFEQLAKHFAPTAHAALVRQALYTHALSLADGLVREGSPREATYFLVRALRARPGVRFQNLKSLVGVVSRWAGSQVLARKKRPVLTSYSDW
ncbi:glycosyltransferase [Hymenobacter pini]|uniref:glycosyltransferase n=1 Tax=Hymenobacter pini TaxID=2880879 RepID=UPI001CF315A6|nr:glycosyltransferase [Hymenobacter pini]MCA8830479.1 glycosyltransferase [Hymenobacter pini]